MMRVNVLEKLSRHGLKPLSSKGSAPKTNLNAMLVSTARVPSKNKNISSCINIYSRNKYFEEKISMSQK